MPLEALWNPANPGYATLLPAIPQREGRGYEGFQYLGLGVLLLLAAAVIVARQISQPAQDLPLRRMRWLVPAFAVLLLLAVSNFPDMAGYPLPRFALPTAAAPLLDMVRASGRLFWPIAYAMVFAAILVVYRLDSTRSAQVLSVLLAIQMLDLSGIAGVVRAQSAEADRHRLYVRTRDPRWTDAIAAARDVTFAPPDAIRDLQLFQEIAWRATSLGRPVRLAYTARVPRLTAARLAAEQRDFVAGRIDPRRLYVVLPSTPIPAAAARRRAVLDGVTVLLPVIPSSPRSAS